MSSNDYHGKYGKQTYKLLSEICRYGYHFSDVFRDFVDACLNTLLSYTWNFQESTSEQDLAHRLIGHMSGAYEERYMQIIRRYKENWTSPEGKRPVDHIKAAFHTLQDEVEQTNEDVLGCIYEATGASNEWIGQFFTPSGVCDVLAEMMDPDVGNKVSDPACGSGRLFISMEKLYGDRQLHYVGTDVAPTVARMAVLNCWMFGLWADIWQGNTLSQEMQFLWRIRARPFGWIWEYAVDNSRVARITEVKENTLPAVQAPSTAWVPIAQPVDLTAITVKKTTVSNDQLKVF